MNKQLLEKNNMCNTNQYERLKFTDLLGRYDHIVIPAIQRDYAQGREDKKATEVRKTLLDDIFSDKPEIDFNLIFGSQEEYGGKTCFIPVDGQQRLTTLFLLYLYNSKVNGVETDGLNKFTYETRRAAADFCKAIVDNGWENQKDKLSDSIKDCNWFMQYWNQDPTVISMLRMLDDIQDVQKRATEGDFSKKLDRITFYFYDLKQKGLNESLYIKMNGRGKPLTAFENLKAAIDNILPKELDYDFKEMGDEASGSNFKEKWQSCIDGKWTDAFWDKDKPHDIDKNLTKFIVRFLSGCYAALKANSNQTTDTTNDKTEKQLRDINVNENNYSSFIPFGPIKKVLELENSFGFLARAFNIISCKGNVHVLYPTWRNSDSPFTISEKTEYKALSVLLAYVLFDGDKKALRFAWNMAENTVSEYNDFINLCNRFGEIKTSEHLDKGIYTVLSNHKFNNPSDQLSEEIAKAKQILKGNYDGNLAELKGKTWEDVILEAENYAFFKGAIRFLFRNENGEWDWKDFDTKWKNAQRYFDKDGVVKNNSSKLLRFFISKFDEKNVSENKNWSLFWGMVYDNSANSWKDLLTKEKWKRPIHEVLISNDIKVNPSYQSTFKTPEWKNIQEELVKTNLLECIGENCSLYFRYDNYLLTLPGRCLDKNKYIIGSHRNKILAKLYDGGTGTRSKQPGKIYSDQKIDGCDFFWGLDVYFQYKKGSKVYDFVWYRDDFVYPLVKGDFIEKIKLSGKELDENNFLRKLDGCIKEY